MTAAASPTDTIVTPPTNELLLARGLELRDRFFALSASAASEDDKQRFRDRVNAIEVEPVLEHNGLSMSHHPSARFKAVRFLPAQHIPDDIRHLFARPSARLPELAAVFVDPEEFSFRTFENIVPLDRWFESLELALADRRPLGPPRAPRAYTFTLLASPDTRELLTGLDSLNLQVRPLNAASRGGQRFIFHAARLSEVLTQAVQQAMPKRWMQGFSHVNPVFRCNRFEPGDGKFSRHIDTPYYDAARKHVSRYTLLIYLTGGRAEPALQIGDDIALCDIQPFTCVIFPQDEAHEGAPYEQGRKLFLRTELIFEHADVSHDPDIAQMFAKACYLTGESVFLPDLARDAHLLYDRAAAAHWGRADQTPAPSEPFIHKHYRGVDFVTNGYDYWFPTRGISIPECAAIAVLDLLNCKIGSHAFRKLCTSVVLDPPSSSNMDASPSTSPNNWIGEFLESRACERTEPVFPSLDISTLFPPPEHVDASICCAFHCFANWDASRSVETVDLYDRAQRWAKSRIASAPITIMGQEIFLNLDKIVVANGKIYVGSEEPLAPVNFAACWNDETTPANYLDVEVVVQAPYLLVPPILFAESARSRHLMVDLFRNSWAVRHRPRAIPVPKILELTEAHYESDTGQATPWLDAAALEADPDHAADSAGAWWSDEDFVCELYADGPEAEA
ncbi:hypothetical protein DB30_02179 [Enhygromyxa salina]|uniref:Fe2OG dioxygenase domain-containing protein n=1 Tax=Enhygromyxa salina TaxID=215803 RepID=A0A0C1ZKD2_9BACT|nr:hypothetical protein [Enhygromyxa salina]KIG17964.1 hypothetical protein DB30_02179 [Enhygromyxa salina]